jgi:hypothetical protein
VEKFVAQLLFVTQPQLSRGAARGDRDDELEESARFRRRMLAGRM